MTLCPRARSKSVRCEPRKPAAPVTTEADGVDFEFFLCLADTIEWNGCILRFQGPVSIASSGQTILAPAGMFPVGFQTGPMRHGIIGGADAVPDLHPPGGQR